MHQPKKTIQTRLVFDSNLHESEQPTPEALDLKNRSGDRVFLEELCLLPATELKPFCRHIVPLQKFGEAELEMFARATEIANGIADHHGPFFKLEPLLALLVLRSDTYSRGIDRHQSSATGAAGWFGRVLDQIGCSKDDLECFFPIVAVAVGAVPRSGMPMMYATGYRQDLRIELLRECKRRMYTRDQRRRWCGPLGRYAIDY